MHIPVNQLINKTQCEFTSVKYVFIQPLQHKQNATQHQFLNKV